MDSTVFIIAGISGSGKSTLSDALMERHPTISRAIAVTTRWPREGERYAYHYYFVDTDRFQWLEETGQLLETTTIYHSSHHYGTLRLSVEQALAQGRHVLLVMDLAGVQQITKTYPNTRSVFLKAPSEAEQRRRLQSRGTTGVDLEERVAKAAEELQLAEERGIPVVVTDTEERAIQEVEQLFGLAA